MWFVKSKDMEHQLTGLETEMGYLIQFPDDMLTEKLTGMLYLENVRDKALSFEQPLVLAGNNVLIPKERLEEGLWELTMEWAYDGHPFTTKIKIEL